MKRAKGFEMTALVYDDKFSHSYARAYDANKVDLVSLFAKSDFLCIVKNYDGKNKGLVSKELLKLLHPKASLFFFTDPKLADFDELIKGLVWSSYHSLVIDVQEKDKALYDYLKAEKKALVTLAESGRTKEAKIGIAKEMIKEVAKVLANEKIDRAINVPKKYFEKATESAVYDKFFSYMGELSSARFFALPDKIELILEGDWQDVDEENYLHRYIEGLSKGISEREVNYINAKLWAEEKGLQLALMYGEKSGAKALAIRFYLFGKTYELAGRILGNSWQILGWDDYQLTAEPTNHLLVLPHVNRPGMIGQVGTLLGERKINISGMVLGHSPTDTNRAMMWIKLDTAPSGDILEALKEMPDIIEATYIYTDFEKGR